MPPTDDRSSKDVASSAESSEDVVAVARAEESLVAFFRGLDRVRRAELVRLAERDARFGEDVAAERAAARHGEGRGGPEGAS